MPVADPLEFGSILRRERIAAGLTQQALAERAGLSAKGVQNLERGTRRPYPDTLARLARALNFTDTNRARFVAAGQRDRRRASDGPSPSRDNLPASLTPLLGREHDVVVVVQLVRKSRLVTLTGTGGVGKTRLALAAAGALLGDFSGAVQLVEFGALGDPGLVVPAVASALGVREQSGRSLLSTLLGVLRSAHMLLVLDNCEHLVEACAALAETLARHCPRLHILSTSREALRIAGEQTWRVPSLAIPTAAQASAAAAPRYGAMALFVARAATAQPDFALTDPTAVLVVEVCRQLDGIPLATELAAARLRALSLDQLASRLDDRLGLLTGGSRTALPRHQTLRATVDWSYALLTGLERMLLRRLAVFEGGWTLQGAESVCERPAARRDRPSILDQLTSLVDKSLVVAETPHPAVPPHGEQRDLSLWYRLLETVRQYAGEKLDATAEAHVIRARHASYYAGFVEEAVGQLSGPDSTRWFERMEREHHNVRAALRWSLGERGDPRPGLRLVVKMREFWNRRGDLSEGRAWFDRALVASADDRGPPRGGVLQGAAIFAWRRGEYERSARLSEENLALWRQLGDPQGISEALYALGLVARDRGEYPKARRFFEEYLSLETQRQYRHGIAWALHALGTIAAEQGDVVSARARLTEALDVWQALGDRSDGAGTLCALGLLLCHVADYTAANSALEEALATYRDLGDTAGIAEALGNLGRVASGRGELGSARDIQHESLRLFWTVGDQRAIAAALERCAALAAGAGDVESATQTLGAAASLRDAIGAPLSPVDRPSRERDVVTARQTLGENRFRAAWAAGQALSLERAIAEALRE